MRLYTAAQMRAADAAAADAGMPAQLLMEAAGRAVAEALRGRFPEGERALVLCGKGNNGGDGYVAARFLAAAGVDVRVLEMSDEPSSGDAAVARRALGAHGLAPAPLEEAPLEAALERCDVVVDALLGSGLDRPLHGMLVRVVEKVTESGLPVVAVDVPTGVSADRTRPPGPHVRAALTVQLAGAKVASAFYPARAAFGATVIADIGIPRELLEAASGVLLLDRTAVGAWMPERPPDAHKYTAGTVLVVAGSERYLGAAELACRAAYRGGAGLVTLAAAARAPGGWPEVVFQPLSWEEDDPLAALDELEPKRAQSLVVGPGLDARALPWIPDLLRRFSGPAVLDAGALSPGAGLEEATRAHGSCVITPHVGEAAGLLRRSAEDVLADPLGSASELAGRFGAVCVLKLAGAVIAAPDGRLAVSTRGHPGMAVGGTGDVLAGLLGATLGGGDSFERAGLAAFLHGAAGELAAEGLGLGLVADDVVAALPDALAELPC
ncbi:MAG TPA: NAD(P)H-hydrate dehydratase [Trueperaceae bacterium]|nr:NAD(P)H-hydrate dehydratase [Trueperaceae bacterium]